MIVNAIHKIVDTMIGIFDAAIKWLIQGLNNSK